MARTVSSSAGARGRDGADHRHAHAGLLRTGKIRCWGIGGSGELGIGSFASRLTPDTDVLNITDAVEIRSGFFSTCARVRDGTAYCWGRLPLGDGTTGNSAVPVKTWTGAGGLGGTMGDGGCILRTDGSVGCWSSQNESGELGDQARLCGSRGRERSLLGDQRERRAR